MFNPEVERKFDKNVSIDSVIEGEMLLAKADYYKTTDFSKVEGVARFNDEEVNSMLEQSKGFLITFRRVKFLMIARAYFLFKIA